MIRGRFLVKARKLGVLVMTFIALAAILRASGVDDPCCDRTAAIIMQCSLVRRARQAGMYNNARSEAKQKGIRFRMTFTQFNERLLAHGNGRM